MKKNQNGFSVIELLIVLVVISAICAAGWLVYKNTKQEKTVIEATLTPLCSHPDGHIGGLYSSDSDAQEDPGEANWSITVSCNGNVQFHDDTVHAINGEDIESSATNQQINDLVDQANKLQNEPLNSECFEGQVDGLEEDYYGKTGERFEVRLSLSKDESSAWTSCRDNNALPSKERVGFFKNLSDLVPGFPYKERLEILSKYNSK